jgi:hypothetical protein
VHGFTRYSIVRLTDVPVAGPTLGVEDAQLVQIARVLAQFQLLFVANRALISGRLVLDRRCYAGEWPLVFAASELTRGPPLCRAARPRR